MYNISILISGAGSTLDNLAFHCYDENEGMLRGFVEIKQVVADRDCGGLNVANKWGIPARRCERKDYESNDEWSNALLEGDFDLHVMGGFLAQIVVPEKWKDRILNIHPSLLPAYGGKGMYGKRVHEAVITAKEQFSGCTIHTVENEIDKGMIIGQIKQVVLMSDDADSLQDAVQSMERKLYPRTILNYLRYLGGKLSANSVQS